MQFADALQMVTRKLSNCGLGIYADDKQRHDRKHAEKPCIECTIQMLDDIERNCLLSVIFYAGSYWVSTPQTYCTEIMEAQSSKQ